MPAPDVVVTDPNRPGMTPKLVKWLRRCGARRIVYVSCNPATLARDVRKLCAPPPEPGSPDYGSRKIALRGGRVDGVVLPMNLMLNPQNMKHPFVIPRCRHCPHGDFCASIFHIL